LWTDLDELRTITTRRTSSRLAQERARTRTEWRATLGIATFTRELERETVSDARGIAVDVVVADALATISPRSALGLVPTPTGEIRVRAGQEVADLLTALLAERRPPGLDDPEKAALLSALLDDPPADVAHAEHAAALLAAAREAEQDGREVAVENCRWEVAAVHDDEIALELVACRQAPEGHLVPVPRAVAVLTELASSGLTTRGRQCLRSLESRATLDVIGQITRVRWDADALMFFVELRPLVVLERSRPEH
jgi:hypothetical protein